MAIERVLSELHRQVLEQKQEAVGNLDKLEELSQKETRLVELRRRLKELGLDLPVKKAIELLTGALLQVQREETIKEEERLILNRQKKEIYRGLRRVTYGERIFELADYLAKKQVSQLV